MAAGNYNNVDSFFHERWGAVLLWNDDERSSADCYLFSTKGWLVARLSFWHAHLINHIFPPHSFVRLSQYCPCFSLSKKNCYTTRMAMSSCGILEKQTVVGSHEKCHRLPSPISESPIHFDSGLFSLPLLFATPIFLAVRWIVLLETYPSQSLLYIRSTVRIECRVGIQPSSREGGGCSSTSWDDPIRWNACFLPIHPEKDSNAFALLKKEPK
jgi:hypothetical protein